MGELKLTMCKHNCCKPIDMLVIFSTIMTDYFLNMLWLCVDDVFIENQLVTGGFGTILVQVLVKTNSRP